MCIIKRDPVRINKTITSGEIIYLIKDQILSTNSLCKLCLEISMENLYLYTGQGV